MITRPICGIYYPFFFFFLLTYLVFFFRKKRKEITTCRDYILYILLLYMNCIYIHIDDTFITCVRACAQFCLLMR
nr:MAG TPA: hypothetical protein [Caudoviricetes sp.]